MMYAIFIEGSLFPLNIDQACCTGTSIGTATGITVPSASSTRPVPVSSLAVELVSCSIFCVGPFTINKYTSSPAT